MHYPEDEKYYAVYPLSKNANQYIEAFASNKTLNDPLKFSTQILAWEMEGYNLVASMIPDDILTTVEAISTSFKEPIYVQTKKPASTYANQLVKQNKLEYFLEIL